MGEQSRKLPADYHQARPGHFLNVYRGPSQTTPRPERPGLRVRRDLSTPSIVSHPAPTGTTNPRTTSNSLIPNGLPVADRLERVAGRLWTRPPPGILL